ncbi:MFS transporter [Inquilinus limosus]|uniref:MFS transporter n=1 Tax=Inquilinus limosus TaxID=171674 RepID=UPI00040AFBFE|nr:MFS transporter [Inquilinus limosus]
MSADRTSTAAARRAGFSPRSLDAINFLLADARGAVGPYLNVYLITERGWSQSALGVVTMVSGIAALALQTPIGAAIDRSRAKRGAIVLALAVMALGAVAIFLRTDFWWILVASTMIAVVGDIFYPAVSAITLGLIGRRGLAQRIGRNAAFDHAGNVMIALLAAAVGWWFSQRAVFLLVPIFAVLAAAATLSIPAQAVDHDLARAADPDSEGKRTVARPAWKVLLRRRPLMVFGICAFLFHFANAPLLPLVGQVLAFAHPDWATAMMSICIVAAQAVMLPISILVGHTADRWGRKPIFLIGFAVLPVRAVLFTLSHDSGWLIAVQLLDGVGFGIYAALTPLVIADLMRGTGHYNMAQGAVATMTGIGASLSGLVAGVVVDALGFDAAFLTLGLVAAVAAVVFAVAMPETRPDLPPDEPAQAA